MESGLESRWIPGTDIKKPTIKPVVGLPYADDFDVGEVTAQYFRCAAAAFLGNGRQAQVIGGEVKSLRTTIILRALRVLL